MKALASSLPGPPCHGPGSGGLELPLQNQLAPPVRAIVLALLLSHAFAKVVQAALQGGALTVRPMIAA